MAQLNFRTYIFKDAQASAYSSDILQCSPSFSKIPDRGRRGLFSSGPDHVGKNDTLEQ